ncbi:MAG TPA: hypothetical protein VF681_13310 [Abditibacteriaceae bacterium]|jgi:hypothetical protein
MSLINERKIATAVLDGHRISSAIAEAAGVSKSYALKVLRKMELAGKVDVRAVRLPARNILAQSFEPTPLLTNRPDDRKNTAKQPDIMQCFFRRELS